MRKFQILIAFAVFTCLSTSALRSADPIEAGDFAGEIRLLLPEKINAVVGVESNLYFDNTVLVVNRANYLFDVTCRRGSQQHERWTFTPTDDDIGPHPLTLEVRDQTNTVIARASTHVEVTPAGAGAERAVSMLIIGDSLTNASVYSGQVLERCLAEPAANPDLYLMGTRGPGSELDSDSGNRHEGYGGWTAERFATRYTGVARGGPYKECGSPFIYKPMDPDGKMLKDLSDSDEKAEPVLDFARYCHTFNAERAGGAPDFVTLLLGCNDTFSSTDDTLEARIDTMFGHYETLVAMIHELSPDTQIGSLLLVPPAASQDAFGANYASNQTRWQYKRNQHRVVERMIETFGGRETENLFLIPAQLNLDTANNYPKREAPANAHTEGTIVRLNNGVHPAAAGYRQIGDSVYAWLKSRLAASD